MSLIDSVNRLSSLVSEPATSAVGYVDGPLIGFSRNTLAESERIIREHPELARAMGVAANNNPKDPS